jgi:hypothetical protein
MQANGAEMLRIACCLATERGVEVCAPVHDAVLICTPLNCLDADIAIMRAAPLPPTIKNLGIQPITLGRILLFDPYWPLHAAKALKSSTVSWPLQYERADRFGPAPERGHKA